MNRRSFLGTLAAAGSTATGFSQSVLPANSAPTNNSPAVISSGPLTRTPLVLMAPRPDGFDAVWAVNQLSKGRLELQSSLPSDPQSFSTETRVISADRFGFVHQGDDILRIHVDGLSPGATYRVRSVTVSSADAREETSPWKTIRPLAPSSGSSRFVVWNDTHINNPAIQKLHDATPSADFLLWNGDTCNDWKSPDLLIPTLLHPGERDITAGRPLFLTWGNHDVRGPHAFEMPRLTPTPSGRPFYAFRSGPVAAICLHTGEDKPDDHPSFGGRVAFDALRHEQAAWLADVIREPAFRDAPYRIVFCHIPLRWTTEILPDYSKTGFDHFSARSRDAWHESLVAWKTQLIISGHTHSSAHLPANDQFPYAQITGGGPRPEIATWMLAEADGNEFNLEVKRLDQSTRHAIKLKPLV